MATKQAEVEIAFHADDGDEAHAAINIKCHNFPDLGANLNDLDRAFIWDRTCEGWHEQAHAFAHSLGYSGCFTEGRSGGWLVPFRQVDKSGKFQKFGAGFPEWTGQGGNKGYPKYPDMNKRREQRTFVSFRTEIEGLLEEVPNMALAAAALYRQDRAETKREATVREAAIQDATERANERRDVVDALKDVDYKENTERFDIVGTMLRTDWHEPDEQGIGALVFGRELDNAFGDYIDPDEPEHLSEIVVVLTKNGNPYCARSLATVLSEAAAYRRAVRDSKLSPTDVNGPSL